MATFRVSLRRISSRAALMVALLLTLVMTFMGMAVYPALAAGQSLSALGQVDEPPYATREPNIAAGQAAIQRCLQRAPGVEAEAFIRTELFFGTLKPNGKEVTARQFDEFLDQVITPAFPDGLTVMTGLGQFRDGAEVKQETSHLLILLYPQETASESSAKIETIREAYEQRFQQQSVLRSDDLRPVCVSF
jgi:predicted ATP-dependent Lon-type protease